MAAVRRVSDALVLSLIYAVIFRSQLLHFMSSVIPSRAINACGDCFDNGHGTAVFSIPFTMFPMDNDAVRHGLTTPLCNSQACYVSYTFGYF